MLYFFLALFSNIYALLDIPLANSSAMPEEYVVFISVCVYGEVNERCSCKKEGLGKNFHISSVEEERGMNEG